MLSQKGLVVVFALSYIATNYGAASFAPLLPVNSLLLTTTAATVLDTTIINKPGNYYLYVDLDGPLVINASQVFINLSGNTINGGVTLTESASTVAMYNGLINGDGGVGITVLNGVKNLLFAQVLLFNCSTGIQADGTLASPIRKIALDQVEVQGATADGGDFTYCQELLIADSTFFSSGNYGLSLQNCSSGLVNNCAFLNNTSTGLVIDDSNSVKFTGCSSSANGSYGYFFGPNAQIVTATNCGAANNTASGFFTQGQTSMIACTANNNSVDGFIIQTAQNSLLQACQATNNTACGFNDLGPVSVSYVSNLAHGNGNDYCVLGAPVLAGAAPYYYATITFGPPAGISSWTNVQA